MTIWKEYKLGEIADIIDSLHKTPTYSNTGYPMVRVTDIKGGFLTVKNTFRVSKDVFDEFSKRHEAKRGDIVMSRVGSYGITCLVKDEINFCLGQNTLFIIPKQNPNFLFYFLNSSNAKNQIEGLSTGSTQKTISLKSIKDISVSVPDLPTQTAIAEILSSLDDKIELNNKINQELENLAQTLFKQWFIDFEFHCLPENYKFSGAVKPIDFDAIMTYKRVGGLPLPDGQSWFVYVLLCDDDSFYKGMTNDLYRRFYEHFTGMGADHTKMHQPVKVIHWEQFDSKEEAAIREKELKTGYGRTWLQRQWAKVNGGSPAPESQLRMAGEMVDSELGEIPKGWEVGVLDDILEVKGGTTPSTKEPSYWDGDFHWTSPRDLSNLQFPVLIDTDKKVTTKGLKKISSGLLPKGTLLLSSRAPIGYLAITEIETAINQGYIAINGREGLSNIYILYWLKLNMNSVIERANGSTFLEISKTNFKQINCIIPSFQILNNYIWQVEILFEQLKSNLLENRELTNLRDTLLPKLISGELEVSEVKEG
jgi:type I restriction enzyme S subunit